jgi:hypothetical protein
MNKQFDTPILFIGFNRPQTSKVVFESIQKIKPSKLYVSIDGPRLENLNDIINRNEVIKLFENLSWNCDIRLKLRSENIGCKNNVVSALDWVFKNEDRVIVLEDDIVPSKAYFYFADELLERYKNKPEIGIIAGSNFTPIPMNHDYTFSKYSHIWGWATWKRHWEKFKIDNILELEKFNFKNSYIKTYSEKTFFKKYIKRLIYESKYKKIDAWGPQFFMYMITNNYLTVVPRKNLVMNIGVESSRKNDVGEFNVHFRPTDQDFLISNYNNCISLDTKYDKIHFKKHINYKDSLFVRVIRKLKKVYAN